MVHDEMDTSEENFKRPRIKIDSDDHAYEIYYKTVGCKLNKHKAAFDGDILTSINIFLTENLETPLDFVYCLLNTFVSDEKIYDALNNGPLVTDRFQMTKALIRTLLSTPSENNKPKILQLIAKIYNPLFDTLPEEMMDVFLYLDGPQLLLFDKFCKSQQAKTSKIINYETVAKLTHFFMQKSKSLDKIYNPEKIKILKKEVTLLLSCINTVVRLNQELAVAVAENTRFIRHLDKVSLRRSSDFEIKEHAINILLPLLARDTCSSCTGHVKKVFTDGQKIISCLTAEIAADTENQIAALNLLTKVISIYKNSHAKTIRNDQLKFHISKMLKKYGPNYGPDDEDSFKLVAVLNFLSVACSRCEESRTYLMRADESTTTRDPNGHMIADQFIKLAETGKTIKTSLA